MNLKTKKGYTLIELLVVIVIIAILASISTATFKSYFGKARDAERQAAIQNIALMIKIEGADDWENSRYIYTAEEFGNLMASNDFRIPQARKDICYFIGMGDLSEGSLVGDENEFVVATWGEYTSIEVRGEEGILADGTLGGIGSLGETLTEEDFSCSALMPFLDARVDFDSLGGVANYIMINEAGELEDLAG
jgi:prepilin-type N-terminal cleavage/methylation domain-containing protein